MIFFKELISTRMSSAPLNEPLPTCEGKGGVSIAVIYVERKSLKSYLILELSSNDDQQI